MIGRLTKIVMDLFPILQPEWVFCEVKEVPRDVLASFYEEEAIQKKVGKTKIDVIIGSYRYKLTPKKEVFMTKRKVSII